MITITVYGLDQFVVGTFSREALLPLASAFEIDKENINFCSPSAMVFHNGVEQTSWHTIVVVNAPFKFRPLEKTVFEVISKIIAVYTINVEVVFTYFEESSCHYVQNKKYPKYIAEENVREREVTLDNDLPDLDQKDCDCQGEHECHCHEEDHECHCHEEGHECTCGDHCECEKEEKDEVFLGNAFEGLEEELEKRK